MCTVTFWPRRDGYVLGMNRDEQRSRVAGLPPLRRVVEGRAVLHPREPSGGTWIALNDAGVTLALVNWYAIGARVEGEAASRGEVVRAAAVAIDPGAVSARLRALPLGRMNPFRLAGVFPQARKLWEWRWDRVELEVRQWPWAPRQWVSSGRDEPGAQRSRGAEFERAAGQSDAGRVRWLRRLHGSHRPERGAYSTCVHRDDAATVSYTEVFVDGCRGGMRHAAGCPCESLGAWRGAGVDRAPGVFWDLEPVVASR